MPSTAFSGVRSSWLMMARNCDLARLACSAASRAATSSRSRLPPSAPGWLKPSASSCSSSSRPTAARRASRSPPRAGATPRPPRWAQRPHQHARQAGVQQTQHQQHRQRTGGAHAQQQRIALGHQRGVRKAHHHREATSPPRCTGAQHHPHRWPPRGAESRRCHGQAGDTRGSAGAGACAGTAEQQSGRAGRRPARTPAHRGAASPRRTARRSPAGRAPGCPARGCARAGSTARRRWPARATAALRSGGRRRTRPRTIALASTTASAAAVAASSTCPAVRTSSASRVGRLPGIAAHHLGRQQQLDWASGPAAAPAAG
jgi:hypothetical protein